MSTYKDAGVDIEAADNALARVREKIHQTYANARMRVLSQIGGFCGIVEHHNGMVEGYTCDGIGSKMKLAVYLDELNGVGADLVAANAHDLLVHGLVPTVLLDYIGVGKIREQQIVRILENVAEACRYTNIALLGGETAEMPVIYDARDCDLVGFAAGTALGRRCLLPDDGIRPGMNIYGLPSSGVHGNGFHLIYKTFGITFSGHFDDLARCGERIPELGKKPLWEELLKPSALYVHTVAYLRGKYHICGMAHITGGGLPGNIPRVLPDGYAVEIKLGSWEVPPIFNVIQKRGAIPDEEMLRVFNNGIGLILISPDDIAKDIAFFIGKVVASNEKKVFFV